MRYFILALAGMATLTDSLSAQVPPPPSMAPVPTLAAPLPARSEAMSSGYGGELDDSAPQTYQMLPMPAGSGYGDYSGPANEYAPIPFSDLSTLSPCPEYGPCPDCPPMTPYLPVPVQPPVYASPAVPLVAGYPFYRAPMPATSLSMHMAGHALRKRAFFHVSPGNMLPSRPIYPVVGGSYYFRPYTYGDVNDQQVQASAWRMHPGFPYAEVAAVAEYADTAACLAEPQGLPSGGSVHASPSRAFHRYQPSNGRE